MRNSRAKKTSGKKVSSVVLALLAATLCFCVLQRASLVENVPVEPEELPEATPTPEPETRKYAIVCPSSESEAVNSALTELIGNTKSKFESDFAKSSGAVLNISGKSYVSSEYYSLEYRVRTSDGSDTTETHIYSLETGEEFDAARLFGDNYAEYLRDYFSINLPEFTEKHTIAVSNEVPIISYSDMTARMAELGYGEGSYHDFSEDTFDRVLIDKNGNAVLLFDEGSLYESNGLIYVTVPRKAIDGDYYATRRIYLDKPMVTMTFDDGPNDETTPQLLDILQEYNSVATLFEVGVHVNEYPEITRRAYEQGCEIGSHTYHHINLAESSLATIQEDTDLSNEAFLKATGTLPTILRPPEGVMGGAGKYFFDVPYIGWSVDTLDWLTKNAASSVKTVKTWTNMEGERNLDGQVILFHDIYQPSIDAVRELVPWLIDEGYQLVTISELFKYWYEIEPEPCLYYNGDYFTYHKDPQ